MPNPMKVLIAYDGSPGAEVALEDLQRAALPNDVEAVVLSVADLWFLPGGDAVAPSSLRIKTLAGEARTTAAAMMDTAKIHAQSACERLRATFPTWHVRSKSVADSPAWAIISEAEAWDADLIVVGSHGYSPLSRWILGSVSQTVLTQAPCSVRIARSRPTTPNRPLRILVGVDGSPEAELAVRTVAKRIWTPSTDIHLVMVLDPTILEAMKSFLPPTEPTSYDGEEEDGIKNLLESYQSLVRQNRLDVCASTILMPGDPKQVLVGEAERWGADCIFIGSRGLNRWERLLLGSVSTAVAARAHCPVEVVRTMHADI